MLYTYEPNAIIKGLGVGTVYYFTSPDCVYIAPEALSKDIDYSDVLTPYVPTSAEAEAMLQDYEDWIERSGVERNSDLGSYLTDLDRHKTDMLARVKSQANAFEDNLNKAMFFTSSLGFRCNGDKRTLTNLQNLVALVDAESNVSYRDYDNLEQELTASELGVLLKECRLNTVKLYKQKWAIQDKIQSAESFDELHAMDIQIHGSDFSAR